MRVSVFDRDGVAARSRVWLDDVEVTNDCQVADDERGEVLLMKRAENGRVIVNDWGEVQKEWKRGRVRIEIRQLDEGG